MWLTATLTNKRSNKSSCLQFPCTLKDFLHTRLVFLKAGIDDIVSFHFLICVCLLRIQYQTPWGAGSLMSKAFSSGTLLKHTDFTIKSMVKKRLRLSWKPVAASKRLMRAGRMIQAAFMPPQSSLQVCFSPYLSGMSKTVKDVNMFDSWLTL